MKTTHTNGNGFGMPLGVAVRIGLWRTPQAWNGQQGPKSRELFERAQRTGKNRITLTDQVRWSTPAAQDAKNASLPPSQEQQDSLIGDVMRAGRWPTPRAIYGAHPGMTDPSHLTGDAIRATKWPTPTASRRSGLQSHGENAVHGSLNPDWVETLMGIPVGWTDLDCDDPVQVPWPAPYVKDGPSPQYDWEPPRVVKGGKDRRKRIAAIGDGQVPQVVEWVALKIKAALGRSDEARWGEAK